MIEPTGSATHTVEARALLADLAGVMGVYAPARFRGIAVRSLCTDSRAASPGCLFFAIPGAARDGAAFMADAIARGAIAVVAARGTTLPAHINGRDGAGRVPLLEVDQVRRAKALAAHAFHGHPSTSLICVGITGTKGKTTTAALLHSILGAAEERPTLIGTIEERVWGRAPRPSEHTTPDALQLAEMLGAARDAGGRSAVMEVSSHALDQERTTGILFRAGVFTQLAREHLDYHPTVDHYRESKARLFESLDDDAFAVVNAEDATGFEMVARSHARLITYGIAPGVHVRAESLELDVQRTRFRVVAEGSLGGASFDVESHLVGRHNFMNTLAACATALALGLEPADVARGVACLPGVPGRLEPVVAGQDFQVLVDYAHTDDALEKVLRLLRPIVRGRLITVFGCGGDRDRTKRPRMGRVAAYLSDRVVITSDNPRSEDAHAIAREILAGVPPDAPVEIELDRRLAIERALAHAKAGDAVLIAGKGHEDYQIVGAERRPFDDRKVARELLCRRCA
jgi:UDP-N-acetylmuramoyl-L-alanyl-D-glutamate--2,6-diaminopimelate ligase